MEEPEKYKTNRINRLIIGISRLMNGITQLITFFIG